MVSIRYSCQLKHIKWVLSSLDCQEKEAEKLKFPQHSASNLESKSVQGDLFLSLQGAKARLVSMPLVGSHSREGRPALCCSSSPSIPTEHPSHSAVRGAAFRSHRVSAVLSFGRRLSNRIQHGHWFNSVFQPWYININRNSGSWALVIHWRHRLSSCRIRRQ